MPFNRSRYPDDWEEMRAAVLKRAGNCCEECGVPNHAFIESGRLFDRWLVVLDEHVDDDPTRPGRKLWDYTTGESVTRIVLTIAHLDNDPETCRALTRLRAWCQRCHLNYDRPRHIAKRRARRHAARAHADLFQEGVTP